MMYSRSNASLPSRRFENASSDGEPSVSGLRVQRRQVVTTDVGTAVHDDHAFDRVAKLADISRPAILDESFRCRVRKLLRRTRVLLRESVVEVRDKERDVLGRAPVAAAIRTE